MKKKNHVSADITLIIVSVVVAVIMIKSGALSFLAADGTSVVIGSFIAGMFIISAFTTVPAIAVLGEIATRNEPLLMIVVVAALGALFGDLLVLAFLRKRLEEDIYYVIGKERDKRLHSVFKMRFFRWFTFFLGALIVASPLPNEAGLMMMGLSKTKMSVIVPASFVLNMSAVYLICIAARSLAGVL